MRTELKLLIATHGETNADQRERDWDEEEEGEEEGEERCEDIDQGK